MGSMWSLYEDEINMLEYDDSDFNKLLEELEEDSKKIDALSHAIDHQFEWLDIVMDVQIVLEKFISNMNSLSFTHDFISKDSTDNSFLIGTLWSGVISSYEGFVHDIFDILLRNGSFSKKANDRIHGLSEELKRHLRINKKNISSNDCLRSLFRRATLNNPNKGAKLANHLFDLNIPEVDNVEMLRALEVRNSYTHNNGGSVVSLSSLKSFHQVIDTTVSDYANGILRQAKNIHPAEIG